MIGRRSAGRSTGSIAAGNSAVAAGSSAAPVGDRSQEHFPPDVVLLATAFAGEGGADSDAADSQHDFAFGFTAGFAQHAGASGAPSRADPGFSQQHPRVTFSVTEQAHDPGAQLLVFVRDFGRSAANAGAATAGTN